MHCNKTLEDCDFLKFMRRDTVYIPMAYRKIVIWLGFRSRVFLDITTQQNQINKNQNIETKKRITRTEILTSNIHYICRKRRIKSEQLGREFPLALIVGLGET